MMARRYLMGEDRCRATFYRAFSSGSIASKKIFLRHTTGFESQPEHVSFLRFTECGDGEHVWKYQIGVQRDNIRFTGLGSGL
jgi:hypothetical protein